ncbi:hypothetical protein M5K25_016275 [Dendrobium thyrsiflorum]|uniref:50S ribosomal protein L18 n=1 Tax=Dendrobium thyrsiflorum TaxID=117978 RepID=A0ABD0UR77_DENTH
MTASCFMKRISSPFSSYSHIVIRSLGFSSETFRSLQRECEISASRSRDDSSKLSVGFHGVKFPQLIPSNKGQLENFNIKLVDPNLWPISFGLAHNLNGMDAKQEVSLNLDEDAYDDEISKGESMVQNSLDFDEIEDLKLHKKLFYKLDRGSKEYEECNFSFHRKKSFKTRLEKQRKTKMVKGCKKSEKASAKPSPGHSMDMKGIHSFSKTLVCEVHNERTSVDKKVRTPTFNQLTDHYHLPFCLDIFITKGSVRASVIHRVTSKVVAVAHSISKDMKFDLTCKKDAIACAAVGEILAQRAIEDDIHNAVYMPRKGDRIEGKLQIVLQSIIHHGVDVKVKLKQKKPVKVSCSPPVIYFIV